MTPRSDLHIHTHHSFDSTASLADCCAAALAGGLDTVAITNHCDFDGILDGFYPSYLPHLDREEIEQARQAFPGLTILRGIELGQAHTYPHLLPHLLRAHDFDLVLASLHNLEFCPDFSRIRFDVFTDGQCCQMLSRYFEQLSHLVALPGITVLAHIDYPMRYMRRFGHGIDLLRFETPLRQIFHTLVENGIALEVNTSGLRQGHGQTLPGPLLLSLYHDCGGRLVTVGSDAHKPADVGADVLPTHTALAKAGFTALVP